MEAHNHSHDHSHNHNAIKKINTAFIVGIVLNFLFLTIEFIVGWINNSAALISDAGHNLSDVVSLLLALFAFKIAKVKPNERYTYGYKKTTILVSLLNAFILLIVIVGIFWESIEKMRHPQPVMGTTIAWVAAIGILINGVTAFLFFRDKDKDLNIKGAYLHLLADALVSLGVVIAGVLINYTSWYILDGIIGIVIALVILFSTWSLLKDSIRLVLDGVPANVDIQKVREMITQDADVVEVHHVHVWAMSTTENAITAHLVIKPESCVGELKHRIKHELEHFNIQHATLEIENEGEACADH